jgi:hypothetical protein
VEAVMSKWSIDTTELFISHKTPKGCFAAMLWTFVCIDLLGCIGFYVLSMLRPEKVQLGVVYVIFVLFGVMFLFAALNQNNLIGEWYLRINRNTQTVEMGKNKKQMFPVYGFYLIEKICLTKEIVFPPMGSFRRDEDALGRPVYHIHLITTEGAYFWLDTIAQLALAKDRTKQVQEYIRKPIENSVDDEILFSGDDEILSSDVKPSTKNIDFDKGKFIQIHNGENERLAVNIRTPIMKHIMSVLALGTISLFPFAMVGNPFQMDEVSFETIAVFLFFGVIFLVFLGAIATSSKRYEILAKEDEIIFRLSFSPFTKTKPIEVSIPKEKIKEVQVHRLEKGVFWLCCSLHNYSIDLSQYIAFNIGMFNANAIRKSIDGDSVLGLWEVAEIENDNESLSFHNLLYIKNWLDNHLK